MCYKPEGNFSMIGLNCVWMTEGSVLGIAKLQEWSFLSDNIRTEVFKGVTWASNGDILWICT